MVQANWLADRIVHRLTDREPGGAWATPIEADGAAVILRRWDGTTGARPAEGGGDICWSAVTISIAWEMT